MKQQSGLIRRPGRAFHLKNEISGEQISLKTRVRLEAQCLLQAHNDSESQPRSIPRWPASVSTALTRN